jgi:3-oxoacyl-(acyl-carrier-protein) synthase
MENKKILITGIGNVSALGYGVTQTWNNFITKNSHIGVNTSWKNSQIKPLFFGQTPDIQFEKEIDWKERFMPSFYCQLGILACKKALEDAQIILEAEDNHIGLIIETCFGATESVEDYCDDLYRQGVQKVSPIKFTKTVANTVLGEISRLFKLNGPSSLLYSNNSIAYGIDLIKKGVAEIVICGGVDHYTEYRLLSLQNTGQLIMAGNKDESYEVNKLYSDDQIKYIPGNGSSFIVLESEANVHKRGAKAYAAIVDYQTSFDYENVDSAYQRSDFIQQEAYSFYNKHLSNDENIVYMSPYISNVSGRKNEQWLVDQFHQKTPVHTINLKGYTGDMGAASSIMGISLAGMILKNNQTKDQPEQGLSGIKKALISNSHEGGVSSHIVLQSI